MWNQCTHIAQLGIHYMRTTKHPQERRDVAKNATEELNKDKKCCFMELRSQATKLWNNFIHSYLVFFFHIQEFWHGPKISKRRKLMILKTLRKKRTKQNKNILQDFPQYLSRVLYLIQWYYTLSHNSCSPYYSLNISHILSFYLCSHSNSIQFLYICKDGT